MLKFKRNILIVGCGGIGCEAVYSMALAGFESLAIIDMDRIDISNLNRQFLFSRKDVGKFKSEIATKKIKEYFSDLKVKFYTQNIFNTKIYNQKFFKSFDLIVSALDNITARKYLNKISIVYNIPLIESGSKGFIGQVYPIIPKIIECYECENFYENTTETNKKEKEFSDDSEEIQIIGEEGKNSFVQEEEERIGENESESEVEEEIAVCSIRSFPEKPKHCVIWAKEFVLSEFFEFSLNLQKNVQEGKLSENSNILKEFIKFFKEKIIDPIEEIRSEEIYENENKLFSFLDDKEIEKYSLFTDNEIKNNSNLEREIENLYKENEKSKLLNLIFIEIYFLIVNALKQNQFKFRNGFDKEDEVQIKLITLFSNFRSIIFNIRILSEFKVKGICGNIIEAFITTNSIIGNLIAKIATDFIFENNKEYSKFWINRYGKDLVKPQKCKSFNQNCKVCGIKKVEFSNIYLENDLNWFFKSFLKDQIFNIFRDESKCIENLDIVLSFPNKDEIFDLCEIYNEFKDEGKLDAKLACMIKECLFFYIEFSDELNDSSHEICYYFN